MLRDKQMNLFIDFLNKIISKNLFLNMKLDLLRRTVVALRTDDHFLILFRDPFAYDSSFSEILHTLQLKCSEQSYKSSIENKYFSRIQHQQKDVSNLQIILLKIIHLINCQWQSQAVSAVKLSEVIFRAHLSNNLLQARDKNLDNFYFDVMRSFEEAEFVFKSDSFFEIFEHEQIVLDHPKSTSCSEFAKLHDFIKILLQGEITSSQILNLQIKVQVLIAKVETASDPFIEISQGLHMLIQYATRLMEISGKFLETDPTCKEIIGRIEERSLKLPSERALHTDKALKKVSKESCVLPYPVGKKAENPAKKI